MRKDKRLLLDFISVELKTQGLSWMVDIIPFLTKTSFVASISLVVSIHSSNLQTMMLALDGTSILHTFSKTLIQIGWITRLDIYKWDQLFITITNWEPVDIVQLSNSLITTF